MHPALVKQLIALLVEILDQPGPALAGIVIEHTSWNTPKGYLSLGIPFIKVSFRIRSPICLD